MSKTYVTFGHWHVHRVNGKVFDKDSVAVIECQSAHDGRQQAVEYFGQQFFTTYFEDRWNPNDLKYFPRGLIEVGS